VAKQVRNPPAADIRCTVITAPVTNPGSTTPHRRGLLPRGVHDTPTTSVSPGN